MGQQILVFAEYGWRNGGENSLLAVVPFLQRKGWEFVFACPSKTELANCLKSEFGIQHVDWKVDGKNGSRKTQEEIRSEIASLLKSKQPAIVHCNSLSTGRLVGPVAAELKIPSLGYLRDILKLSNRAISDINQLDKIIAVSKATLNFHVERGLERSRAQVIYNGVDLEAFSPRPATGYLHQELGIEDQASLILCIGQIGLRKGTEIVVQSFLRMCAKVDDLHLVLIGMRNSQKQESIEFERQCHRIGLDSTYAERIHWLGRRCDVRSILGEAKLLLHAARQEPLGRVLIEASASGCPFVATDVGGTPEIVGPKLSGVLTCQVDSVSQMSDRAIDLLMDKELWHRVRQDVRKNAEMRFADRRCAAELNEIYRGLVRESAFDC